VKFPTGGNAALLLARERLSAADSGQIPEPTVKVRMVEDVE
jgi:hypothetical protein